jgi:hypothetical protein
MSERGVTRVVLHIDRLNLRGIAPEQRIALVQALHEALAQHLSASLDAPAAVAALTGRPAYQPYLAAGRTPASINAAAAIGAGAGRQIAGSLTR